MTFDFIRAMSFDVGMTKFLYDEHVPVLCKLKMTWAKYHRNK